ncbi:hypothetical protein CDAR_290641 [Caerostris darwini]|uniref:Uncharacterized protein n=1 Tax=Caerostris darwini TaxID=1538125 RepID=A0AAV4SWQ6_9ARAC|nr:hypothetical protein CDAR_290641 [Caerostris darwini]
MQTLDDHHLRKKRLHTKRSRSNDLSLSYLKYGFPDVVRRRYSFKNWRQRIPRALETSVDLNAEHRAINERQGRKSGFSVFFNNPTPPRDTRGV